LLFIGTPRVTQTTPEVSFSTTASERELESTHRSARTNLDEIPHDCSRAPLAILDKLHKAYHVWRRVREKQSPVVLAASQTDSRHVSLGHLAIQFQSAIDT
jgi:hypothetical protein